MQALVFVQEILMTDLDASLAQARAYAAHNYSANTHATRRPASSS
jgi:hypothetical protein